MSVLTLIWLLLVSLWYEGSHEENELKKEIKKKNLIFVFYVFVVVHPSNKRLLCDLFARCIFAYLHTYADKIRGGGGGNEGRSGVLLCLSEWVNWRSIVFPLPNNYYASLVLTCLLRLRAKSVIHFGRPSIRFIDFIRLLCAVHLKSHSCQKSTMWMWPDMSSVNMFGFGCPFSMLWQSSHLTIADCMWRCMFMGWASTLPFCLVDFNGGARLTSQPPQGVGSFVDCSTTLQKL